MAWPAIAMASSAKASRVQARNAIWCAAIAAFPCRAATAVTKISTAAQDIPGRRFGRV